MLLPMGNYSAQSHRHMWFVPHEPDKDEWSISKRAQWFFLHLKRLKSFCPPFRRQRHSGRRRCGHGSVPRYFLQHSATVPPFKWTGLNQQKVFPLNICEPALPLVGVSDNARRRPLLQRGPFDSEAGISARASLRTGACWPSTFKVCCLHFEQMPGPLIWSLGTVLFFCGGGGVSGVLKNVLAVANFGSKCKSMQSFVSSWRCLGFIYLAFSFELRFRNLFGMVQFIFFIWDLFGLLIVSPTRLYVEHSTFFPESDQMTIQKTSKTPRKKVPSIHRLFIKPLVFYHRVSSFGLCGNIGFVIIAGNQFQKHCDLHKSRSIGSKLSSFYQKHLSPLCRQPHRGLRRHRPRGGSQGEFYPDDVDSAAYASTHNPRLFWRPHAPLPSQGGGAVSRVSSSSQKLSSPKIHFLPSTPYGFMEPQGRMSASHLGSCQRTSSLRSRLRKPRTHSRNISENLIFNQFSLNPRCLE